MVIECVLLYPNVKVFCEKFNNPLGITFPDAADAALFIKRKSCARLELPCYATS